MECVVEGALKTTRFRKEMAFKFSQQQQQQQVFFEDFCSLNNNGMQNVTSSDEFIVDELLDFSNEEACNFIEQEDQQQQKPSLQQQQQHLNLNTHQQKKPQDSVESSTFTELCVPTDDLASLEWLSHFVEDSNSEYSTPFPAGIFHDKKPKEENYETHNYKINVSFCAPQKPAVLTDSLFKTPVSAKARRSKRARTTGLRVWPFGSPSFTDSSSSSTSTTTTTSSSSSCPSSPSYLVIATPGIFSEPTEPVYFERPPAKKQKKSFSGDAGGFGGGFQPPRRCSHCGVQKTPQWRAGPLGAKTLCNACGVRFKSGRLLPEYRPACSPTFSTELHSNHHRKVLEMRKKKESLGQDEPGLAPQAVPSF